MNKSDIRLALIASGIKPGDLVMIHGDAMVAAQIRLNHGEDKLAILYSSIIEYLGEQGTLVVPAFTYSFGSNEEYDVNNSPSKVGQFSESFRLFPGVERSKNPMFSVCAFGKLAPLFSASDALDCFGENSCFGLMHSHNGKLVNLGCDFMVTFVHYVEQYVGVNYRYFKKFSGYVIGIGKQKSSIDTKYYVRDCSIKSEANLNRLKVVLLKKNLLTVSNFGRLICYLVNSTDFFREAVELLNDDPYALIEEGAIDA